MLGLRRHSKLRSLSVILLLPSLDSAIVPAGSTVAIRSTSEVAGPTPIPGITNSKFRVWCVSSRLVGESGAVMGPFSELNNEQMGVRYRLRSQVFFNAK